MALQYGVPLKDLVNKFAHVRFEPSGFTGNQEIPIAKSIVDYIFRWLGSRFLSDDDKAMLGLIDRSALVDGRRPRRHGRRPRPASRRPPPAARATGSRPAYARPPRRFPPSASAYGHRHRFAQGDRRCGSDPVDTAPAKEELAVIATNGHANGHAANGNGERERRWRRCGRPSR